MKITYLGPLGKVLAWLARWYDPECLNCGMFDVPLRKGYCEGCICAHCHKNAGQVGRSMNDMGWCDDCESLIVRVALP